jgi:hypothetical protein
MQAEQLDLFTAPGAKEFDTHDWRDPRWERYISRVNRYYQETGDIKKARSMARFEIPERAIS